MCYCYGFFIIQSQIEMYCRFLFVPTYKLSTSLVATSSKQATTRSIIKRNVANILSTPTSRRLFSVLTTPEDMIVGFDEVLTATSKNDTYIIDVRELDEIKEHGNIPNSINIPLGDVTNVLGTMPDKEFAKAYNRSKPSEDSPIIFYCMIGKRSGMAQQNTINLGYKNVKNYLGSWTDWATRIKS